jgi:polyphenol oxidase
MPPEPMILYPDWPAPANVRAAFTLRGGGVSRAAYESLNLAQHVGDADPAVTENRRRVNAKLALPSEPLWLSQLHGTQVHDADAESRAPGAPPPPADAAMTRARNHVLAVLVADCLPVLLAHRDGAAIAVAHAGWRGLAAGVLEAALAALACPPGEVCAWLGPAIGAPHFEVGDEVLEAFTRRDAAAHCAFTRNERGRWQCDLHGLAEQRLRSAGVQALYGERRCTFSEPERFYSYRRDGATGRMAALLWMAQAGRRKGA